MHLLAGFLLEAVLGWVASKAARLVVMTALAVTLLGGLWLALNALLNGISVLAMSDGYWGMFWMGVNFLVPTNFTACLTVMFSADLLVFMYRFYTRTLAAM